MDFTKFLNKICETCNLPKRLYGEKPHAVHLCPNCDRMTITDMTANGKMAQ